MNMEGKPCVDYQEVQVHGVESKLDVPEESLLMAFKSIVMDENSVSGLSPEERKYYLINKDTGEVVDMRNEKKVERIMKETENV